MRHFNGQHLVVLSNAHPIHDCRIHFRQALFAANSGLRVSIFAIEDGGRCESIDAHGFPPAPSRFRRFLLGWRLALLAAHERADLYHFHDPEMLLPMTALRFITRRPVIYDCHENVVDSIRHKPYIPRLLRSLLAKCVYVIQWLCTKLLGTVVVATAEQLEMFPASVQHLVVQNFPPLSIQPEVDFESDRPHDLVHCGTLSRERGSSVLLETLRILVHELGRADCQLLLIGTTFDRLEEECRQFLLEHRLERNITFRGYIPLDEVPRQLTQAKIGLMCHQATQQYRYGVASKLFDYMAAGLAIVGGRADFDREFAPENRVKIYVDETKPQEYAREIVRLLDDVERRIAMGRQARQLFEERYTAESQAEALLEFYQQQLCPKKSTRVSRTFEKTKSPTRREGIVA